MVNKIIETIRNQDTNASSHLLVIILWIWGNIFFYYSVEEFKKLLQYCDDDIFCYISLESNHTIRFAIYIFLAFWFITFSIIIFRKLLIIANQLRKKEEIDLLDNDLN